MRSARLVATLLYLQRSGFATAPELADEFEVSTRTVLRDVEALQIAGLPIWTSPGAGGGIHLDRRRDRVDLDMTSDESVALLVDERRATAAGLAPALRTARSRLASSVPGSQAELLSCIDDRFLVDTAPWFQPPPTVETPTCLPTIATAVRNSRRLDIARTVDGDERTARVDPLGVVVKHGVHYLIATHRRRVRTYRLDRIHTARIRNEPATVPDGFDLEDHWARFVAEFEAHLRPIQATIRLDPGDIDALRRAAPGAETDRAVKATTNGTVAGSITIELTVEALPTAAHQLSAVPSIDVIRPLELRRALADHAETVALRNRSRRQTRRSSQSPPRVDPNTTDQPDQHPITHPRNTSAPT